MFVASLDVIGKPVTQKFHDVHGEIHFTVGEIIFEIKHFFFEVAVLLNVLFSIRIAERFQPERLKFESS